MPEKTIAFIGGGNMAASLIGGLIERGHPSGRIRVGEPDEARRQLLRSRFGVEVAASNEDAVQGADVVVLAVKPQVMEEVARGLGPACAAARPLIVSIAAGVRLQSLSEWLGYPAALVRCMPNTPALVGEGASALYANEAVGPEARETAQRILEAVGLVAWVPREEDLDAVTALSGSGPAYYFLLMELMTETGVEMGLSPDTARALTLQTALGAARMARESGVEPARLREQVTSPGGTTERALRILTEGGIRELVRRALLGARDRSRELGGG